MKRETLKVKINRLFIKKVNGKTRFFASIRDYIVRKAQQDKKDLLVLCEKTGEEIIIPYERIKEGIVSQETFKSKIDNRVYRLVDFDWKRFQKPDLENPKLFSQLVL